MTELHTRIVAAQRVTAHLYKMARYELDAGGKGPASLQRARSLQRVAARESRHVRRLMADI